MSDPAPAPSRLVVTLREVTKRFGDVTALDAVDLDVRAGEVLAVVGPSGCGKSTLLRLVAGLTAPDRGSIRLGDDEVVGPGTWIPPERRHVGFVFQDHALFPHLDVAGNVAFGLDRRSPGRAGRLDEVLELVGLAGLRSRYPHELSGGEQQRVALARALAPAPVVVLLDEPFSNLDRNLRTRIRDETVRALRASGSSVVFVTHDQEEALTVGDRVAVARAGALEQIDTPETVFHAPGNRFVATFMGEADFIPGHRRADGKVETEIGTLVSDGRGTGPVDVMVRPHELEVVEDPTGTARVERTEFRGATVLHHVRLGSGHVVRVLRPHTDAISPGTAVRAGAVPGHAVVAFEPGSAAGG